MNRAFEFGEELHAGSIVDFNVTDNSNSWQLSGWATTGKPRTWAYICCRDKDQEAVFYSIANHYNEEAFEQGLGFGWIGFNVDLAPRWERIRGKALTFYCAKSGRAIFEYDVPDEPLGKIAEDKVKMSVKEFVSSIKSHRRSFEIETLSLYASAFVKVYGTSEFIKRAYTYILDREVDDVGLREYVGQMQRGLAPEKVLSELLNSGEYKEKSRDPLTLPGDARFPFYPD